MKTRKKQNFFSKLDKKTKIVMIVSASVVVVCLATIIGVTLSKIKNITNIEPIESGVELESVFENPFSDKVVNFLLCGVDGDSTPGRTAVLPDVMIVASFNMEKNEVNMLQIPRDTFVGDDIITGKMNAVYSTAPQGAKANRLIKKINDMFDIAIDYYIVTTMEALKITVDGVGGFEMDVPASINLDGVHVDKGIQTINGTKAAAIIRNRYNNGSRTEIYYNGGDIRRLETQQILIKAFAKKVISSPVNLVLGVLPDIYDLLQTNLSMSDLKNYIRVAMNLDVENIHMFVCPGSGVMHNTYSVYNLNKAEMLTIINDYFRPYQGPLTMESLKLPQATPDSYKPSSSTIVPGSEPSEPVSSESPSDSSEGSSESGEVSEEPGEETGSEAPETESSQVNED